MAQSLPPTTGDLRTFGAFHFDPARGELFQHGDKQKLTQQPARVLERLTATPRLIVRREELARVLWPSDPPANPSAGINNAILTLRRLFGDDAENPTYIRSVAGEGYVFLLPVARGQLNGHSHAGGHAGVANADGQSGDAAPVTVQTAGSRVATDAGASTISPRRSSQLFVTLVRSSLATLAVVMLSIALFTPAVGIDAAAFALLFAALIVFWEDVPDSVLTRATVSLVLLAGMAYVPSAWTLYELSGHVINFDALGPASLYPFFTGMQYLPLFTVVFACWTLSGAQRARWLLDSPITYGALCALVTAMTVVGLVGYSGESEIWRGDLPGSRLVALGYAGALTINAVTAWLGRYILRGGTTGGSRRLLGMSAIAYIALLVPAMTVDHLHNVINRGYLDVRRPNAYRATHPEAVDTLLAAGALHQRSDVGDDLRRLLSEDEFRAALRERAFHLVAFDEPFQLRRRAVMFGYRRPETSADAPALFRIIRFPADIARSLGFELVQVR